MANNGIEAQKTWRGSAIKQRPPGFSTRYISAMARLGSGKMVNNREAIKMSNSVSAQESSSALIRLNEQLVRPKASARSRAHCNWLSERSAPVTEIFIVAFRGNRGCRRFNRSMSRSYGIRQHFIGVSITHSVLVLISRVKTFPQERMMIGKLIYYLSYPS